MKLTGTNRPITYTTHPLRERIQKTFTPKKRVQRNKTACVHYVVPNQQTRHGSVAWRTKKLNHNTTPRPHQGGRGHVVTTDYPPPATPRGAGEKVTAVTAWGKRPVPSRTRKLRPTAPMVLHPGGCGRVGRRRTPLNRSRTPHPTVRGPPHLTPKPKTLPQHPQVSRHPPAAPAGRHHPPAAPAEASGPDPRKVRERPDGTRRT